MTNGSFLQSETTTKNWAYAMLSMIYASFIKSSYNSVKSSTYIKLYDDIQTIATNLQAMHAIPTQHPSLHLSKIIEKHEALLGMLGFAKRVKTIMNGLKYDA